MSLKRHKRSWTSPTVRITMFEVIPMKANIIIFREDSQSADDVILELLSQAKQPLSVSTIGFLLSMPSRNVCMALNRLGKYNEVRKVTRRPLQFWESNRRKGT